MRITGGQFRGRVLKRPSNKDIRPASDKVRQAVFNMLLPYGLPDNATVLDLFCGTGSYGLEALSRGASHCDFVDKSPEACNIMQHNFRTLDIVDIAQTHKMNVLKYIPSTTPDLIFIDPPYEQDLVNKTLEHVTHHILQKGKTTFCVIEMEKKGRLPAEYQGSIIKHKEYGVSQVIILELSNH